MICVYCQREFEASKYRHTKQKACGDPECQKKRQRDNLLAWRDRNPLYYRIKRLDPLWRSKARSRARRWRVIHKDRIQTYRVTHMEEYRVYMREYMRRYRQSAQPAPPTETEKPKEG